jgi:hypothetical protein
MESIFIQTYKRDSNTKAKIITDISKEYEISVLEVILWFSGL